MWHALELGYYSHSRTYKFKLYYKIGRESRAQPQPVSPNTEKPLISCHFYVRKKYWLFSIRTFISQDRPFVSLSI